jgi:hypothetical protein
MGRVLGTFRAMRRGLCAADVMDSGRQYSAELCSKFKSLAIQYMSVKK